MSPTELVTDSVEVAALVTPAQLSPGDSLTVAAVFRNRLDRPLSLGFGAGCPFLVSVRSRRLGALPLDGSQYGCTANLTGISIPSRDAVVHSIRLVASVDDRPVLPGEYVVTLDFTNGAWELERSFLVR